MFRRLLPVTLLMLGTLSVTLAIAPATLAAIGHSYEQSMSEKLVETIPGKSFSKPWSLTFGSSGSLFLADPGASRVDVFDSSNAFQAQLGEAALSGGFTRGVALDNTTGDVYVGDSNKSEVVVMASGGELLSQWTGAGTPAGTFGSGCCYIYDAVDNSAGPRKGYVYVMTTQGRGEVDVLKPKPENDQEGEFVEGLTAPEEGFSFESVDGLAVDSATGTVYVANAGHQAVDAYNDKGEFQGPPLDGGETPAGFFQPVGVAIDSSSGELYVVDAAHGVVDQFTAAGKYEGQITGPPGQPFASPLAVAVSPAGRVYVADGGARAVDVFGPDILLADVDTGEASPLARTSATIHGSVKRNGKPTTYHFEYGETTSYGSSTAVASVVAEQEEVSAELSTLSAGTTYYYRLVAENENGPNYGEDRVFSTSPAVDGVQTSAATNVLGTEATLNGLLEPNGFDAHYWFEYGTSEAYEARSPGPPGTDAGEAAKPEPAAVSLAGLQPNLTYHFRLAAENAFGVTHGSDETLKTQALAPALSTPSARTTRITANLTAIVNPENSATTYRFEYGPTEEYGSSTPPTEAGANFGEEEVIQQISELEPETTYHFRVLATNEAGTSSSADQTFTTAARTPPLVTTGGATAVTMNAATISATIGTRGLVTTYGFEVGTGAGYGPPSGSAALGASGGESSVTLGLQGLQPGTTYRYRVTATNQDGTSYGADQAFTTAGFAGQLPSSSTTPLLPTPLIAFPAQAAEGAASPAKPLTRAQKLAKALKACGRKPKGQRASCAKHARRRYGPRKRKA